MIARWNRREVFAGNSMQEFNRILNILSNKNIKYIWNKVNRSFFDRTVSTDMYYIYVHKEDVEEVRFLIRR